MDKIAVFVDVQNIYYTTRQSFGRQFDYHKLWQLISQQGDIVIANAYAIDRGDAGQIKFQNALRNIGFDVKLKPYIQRCDGTAKGDWDVGITIDVLEQAQLVDRVVLLSGDGDFSMLLDKLSQTYAVPTEVYGVSSLTANTLIESANLFHPIDMSLLK